MLLFSYIFVSILMIVVSLLIFRRMVNPLCIYMFIWLFCVVLHEMPFAGYYRLNIATYYVLFQAHVAFFCGCLLSKIIIKSHKVSFGFILRNDTEKKLVFEKILLALSVMAGISIWTKFFRIVISTKGHVLANIGQMYKSDIYKESSSSLSLSTIVFPVALLVGVYICRYGFSRILIIPTLDVLFLALSSGSRGSIIIILALMIAPFSFMISGDGSMFSDQKFNWRNHKKGIIAITMVLVLVVFASTYSRAIANGVESTLISSVLRFLSGYLSAGVAGLNEYLKKPTIVGYPQFFFRVPFILLNKFNITHVDTDIYMLVETYYTPKPSNVLTYIGELYHDFGKNFFWVIFIMAFVWVTSYEKTLREKSFSWLIVYACFFVIFVLSFFSNFGHISALWIVACVGIPCSWIIDYRIFR